MKISKKVGDASVRVLETLKLLSKKSLSIKEIINSFEKTDSKSKVYTNEVILKYINTLKVCGFVFEKEKDKYKLLNPPVRFELNSEDLIAISLIKDITANFPEEKVKKETINFIQDLEKHLDDKTQVALFNIPANDKVKIHFNYDKYKDKIKKYEKYCLSEQKLKITYIDENQVKISSIFEPNELKYSSNRAFFSVYNHQKAQITDIDINNIIEIEQLPIKSNMQKIPTTVTFKLKGRLAKAYNLHEGERLQDKIEDGIVVVNQFEDRDILLRRLMKYGEKCEVIYPKMFREDIKNLIKKSIENYQKPNV